MSEQIQLRDPRPTRKITLPSFAGSEVEIYPSLLTRDLRMVASVGEGVEAGLASLPFFIKVWNFDKPVGTEAIGELPATDLTFLFEEIKKFGEEQKKS